MRIFFVVTLLVSISLSSSDEEVCDVKESEIGVLRPEDLPSESVFQEWTNSTIQLSGKVRSSNARSFLSLSLKLRTHNTCYDLELIKLFHSIMILSTLCNNQRITDFAMSDPKLFSTSKSACPSAHLSL